MSIPFHSLPLLEEIVQSLETTDLAQIEQELIDLNLLRYCQPSLDRRKQRNQGSME